MLGLKHNVNVLAEYDPEWPREFAMDTERIVQALWWIGEERGTLWFHSRSRNASKPIIDILVGILLVEDWVACEAPLERLGYDYAANAGVPGHHIFGRGRNNTGRTHFVHIVGFMGDEWRWNLALRGLRVAYVAEKERAAAAAPEGRVRYNELKGPFINKIKATLTRADSGRESRDTASQELRCILRAQLLQWLRYRRNPV